MVAMIVKEFRQMWRDRRTVALMVGLPLMMLIIFGYAARFDISAIPTIVAGPGADQLAPVVTEQTSLEEGRAVFNLIDVRPEATSDDANDLARNAEATVVFVTDTTPPTMLVDGSQLFAAQSALRHLPAGVQPKILFNPTLDTSTMMVPSLIGLIMLFVGTVITSLGVVREREQGTLEQLAVMPLRPADVVIGKIAPYFAVAVVDMIVVTVAGIWLFDVPFEGSVLMFAVYVLVFLFVVLGMGVAISTVSQSQGQAIQLAIMMLLPQVMLSGMIFPLDSMAAGVRWIGYLLPLTWFIEGMRGIFLRGSDVSALIQPLVILVAMALVVFGVALARFRQDLAPRRSPEPAPTTGGRA
jgi:ABC-2 type transport system permease protein